MTFPDQVEGPEYDGDGDDCCLRVALVRNVCELEGQERSATCEGSFLSIRRVVFVSLSQESVSESREIENTSSLRCLARREPHLNISA